MRERRHPAGGEIRLKGPEAVAEEVPGSERKLAGLERRRDEIKGALAKYYKLFESSPPPIRL